MQTYEFTTPVTLGTITNQVTVARCQLVNIHFQLQPDLAPIGQGTIRLTLKDPESGYLQDMSFTGSEALTAWLIIGDPLCAEIFALLQSSGNLPPGVMTTALYPTTVTLWTSLSAAIVGEPVVLTALIVSSMGNVPSGEVAFLSGETVLGTAAIVNGLATYTVTPPAAADYSLTASFGATASFAAAVSPAVIVAVTAA